MIDQLKSLGIEKGKPYKPDEVTTKALESGVREAHALLEAKYDAGMPPFFSETSRWMYPAPPDLIKAMQSGFADPDNYPVDERGMAYTYAFIGLKRLGAGQFYSISIRDKDGDAFDGSKTYRLTVPPNVPVEQYWSVTAYDTALILAVCAIPLEYLLCFGNGRGLPLRQIAKEIIDQIVNELYGQKILSNLARPLYVERLLARLLRGDWRYVGGDWSGWDLENSTSNLRIEVKQSAARQTWTDGPTRVGKSTKPIFDIQERTGYYANGSRWIETPGRPADLYIFAWHPVFDPAESVDHTDPEQWEFYLLPERRLPKGQKTISLSSLKKLGPVFALHSDVGEKVDKFVTELQPLKCSTT